MLYRRRLHAQIKKRGVGSEPSRKLQTKIEFTWNIVKEQTISFELTRAPEKHYGSAHAFA